MKKYDISACVTTFNEAHNIHRCLSSLTWCGEIVVVDSFSTDRTTEICREYTDRVYQHEWLGYIGQKNLIRKLATHEWLFFVDADEEVSDELRRQIIEEFENGPGDIRGYEFPRMVYYMGRWIKYGEWYPDIKLRLFRKDSGRSGGQEPHDQVFVNGTVKRLTGHLHHYTYDDLHDHIETMNRYSSITAEEKYKEGKRFGWTDFVLRPPFRFLKSFLLKRGFMDGTRGFLIATVSAFGVCVKYAKLWELELIDKHKTHEIRRRK
jgi:glycosyltransferase involved in cell wall biosynthesis